MDRIETDEIEAGSRRLASVKEVVEYRKKTNPDRRSWSLTLFRTARKAPYLGRRSHPRIPVMSSMSRSLTNAIYGAEHAYSDVDDALNRRVWTSSYTNQALALEHVVEAVETAAASILALRPENVLEIGVWHRASAVADRPALCVLLWHRRL